MFKNIWLLLLFLIQFNVLFAEENICHKMPPGKCEDCCQKLEEAAFQDFAVKSCVRLHEANSQKSTDIDTEVMTYLASSKIKNENRANLYRSYLSTNCDFKTGKIKGLGNVKMAYAECASGCPKPKGKKKNEMQNN